MAITYQQPGSTITKIPTNVTATFGPTQRFPMFVGIGRNIIQLNNEAVVRGHDDNPTNPAQAPRNGKDSLSRPAVSLISVSSQPGIIDFTPNLDYILTDGKVDWGPEVIIPQFNENSTGVLGTYQVVVKKPSVGIVSQCKNYSAFVSAVNLAIGGNATYNAGTNVISIQLAHFPISNAAANNFATRLDNSLVFHGDSNNRFLPSNLIDYATPFTQDKQWKVDFSNGLILSYSTIDATLPAGLNLDYFYVATYNLTGLAVSPDGASFVLSAANNTGLPTFFPTDFLSVSYTSVSPGREPAPGQTYYVTYTALKLETELIPKFYNSTQQMQFQLDNGVTDEFLTNGNQLALLGEIQFTLGTQGFWISPVRADNLQEWGLALQRTSELNYDDLVVLTDELDVQQIARKLALDRSSPIKKHRTIPWFATYQGQPSGIEQSLSGDILSTLDTLRNERVVYVGTQRMNQTVLINIPLSNGTVQTNVPVSNYWAVTEIVNGLESFASPSDSSLRFPLIVFRTDVTSDLYTNDQANILASNGLYILEDTLGVARVRDDITTVGALGTPDQMELSVRTAEDAFVQKIIEPNVERIMIGLKITSRGLILSQFQQLMADIFTQAAASNLIASGQLVNAQFDPKNPTRLTYQFAFTPDFILKILSGVYSITLP